MTTTSATGREHSPAPASRGLTAELDEVGHRSGGARFPALDGYRGAAALMVVLTHVAFATAAVVRGGPGPVLARFDFGVTLFFLLSGFLLFRPWVLAALGAPQPRLRTYAIRRAARVLPLYWVVVVTVLLVLPDIRPVTPQMWWQQLLAVHIYIPGATIEGLTQTWSLATEIAFYVALPFIGALVLGRRRRSPDEAWRRAVIVLGALTALAWCFVSVKGFTDVLPDTAGYWLPFYLDWFAAGMMLAVMEVHSRRADPPRAVVLAQRLAADTWTCVAVALGLFALACTPLAGAYDFTPTGGWGTVFRHLLYLGTGVFLLLPVLLGGDSALSRGLSRRVPVLLGLISYGVFLWHLLLLRLLMPALGIPIFTGRTLLVIVVVVPCTLLVAAVTYRLVERPAQRWAHRR